MTLYRAYQLVGGEEAWVTCHSDIDFDDIKPTFITVLACDTLIAKDSPKPMVEGAKYLGPCYFDLDDANDVEAAITGAQALWAKLKGYGLTEQDVEIYLSGKKGLHLLIQPVVFMEKVLPVNKLPAIYKEMAFSLAVDTLDFSVYSARRGRMFRTHYNVRDNANYKVQISTAELETLDAESYGKLCKTPRALIPTKPVFRPQFAILYAGIDQKIKALKKIRTKPVDAATLRRHLPIIQQLMKGESVKEGVGFNKIAIQLAIYANEAKLTEDELVNQCQGLIKKHNGDGYRYNTPSKREREIRRMFCYMEDGAGYQYALGPIQSMLESRDEFSEDDDQEEFSVEDTSGIFIKNNNYYAATEQGDRHIMDGCFKEVTALLDPRTESIALLKAKLVVGSRDFQVKMERDDFASNSAMHKAISNKGASFTGSDIHSRYIYTHMLKEIKTGTVISYATTSEGVDVLCMPHSPIIEARTPFLVWADITEVRVPTLLSAKGLKVELAPDPGPDATMKTDIIKAPTWPNYVGLDAGNFMKMHNMIEGLIGCQEAASLSKLIGWTTASIFTQMFRRVYGKFPLMHVAGPAGTGKTEMMTTLMRMFYLNQKPEPTNAATTVFGLSTIISSSASIPVVIDEYKPHTMGPVKVEEMRSMFRSSYNGASVSRGGGNRNSTSFRSLSQVTLSGPVVFMAEAMETEAAILHRSVLVTLKRQTGRFSGRTKPSWDKLQDNKEALSIVGQHIAATIVERYDLATFKTEFDAFHARAYKLLSVQPEDDLETCDASTLMIKRNMNERIIFNYAVAEFGLHWFADTVELFLPDQKDSLAATLRGMVPALYSEMDKIVKNSVAEYIKVFEMLSDMSRFPVDHQCKLTNQVDYQLEDMGGLTVINIVTKLAYNKYRIHCRNINILPLFMNADSFSQAMKDSPVFIRQGTGTSQIKQESIVLDYDELVRSGVYAFFTK